MAITIIQEEQVRRIVVTGDPTEAGVLKCVVNVGDIVYRKDTATTYIMTAGGLVVSTSLDDSPVFASVTSTGGITSSGGGIGYATGAGGAVTQLTDRSTGVTLNKLSGAITTDSTSLAAGASATFTVTNSTVAIGDVVIISKRSGGTANTTIPHVSAVAAGSFNITMYNRSADTADTAATIINFAVIKAVGA